MQETLLYLRDLWRHGVLGLPTPENAVAETLRPLRVFEMINEVIMPYIATTGQQHAGFTPDDNTFVDLKTYPESAGMSDQYTLMIRRKSAAGKTSETLLAGRIGTQTLICVTGDTDAKSLGHLTAALVFWTAQISAPPRQGLVPEHDLYDALRVFSAKPAVAA